MAESINILFICTENACRSQIAEGWAKALHQDQLAVRSAGVVANGVNPNAVEVMREAGIDISAQRSEVVAAKDYEWADIIVTVCEQADRHCPTLPAGKIKYHWPIKNPVGLKADSDGVSGRDGDVAMQVFQRCRDEIKKRIISLFQMEGIAHSEVLQAKPTQVLEQVSS